MSAAGRLARPVCFPASAAGYAVADADDGISGRECRSMHAIGRGCRIRRRLPEFAEAILVARPFASLARRLRNATTCSPPRPRTANETDLQAFVELLEARSACCARCVRRQPRDRRRAFFFAQLGAFRLVRREKTDAVGDRREWRKSALRPYATRRRRAARTGAGTRCMPRARRRKPFFKVLSCARRTFASDRCANMDAAGAWRAAVRGRPEAPPAGKKIASGC